MKKAFLMCAMLLLCAGWMPERRAHAIAPSAVLKRMEESWGKLRLYQVDLRQRVENTTGEEKLYQGGLYIHRGKRLRLDYNLLSDAGAADQAPDATGVMAPDDIYLADMQRVLHWDRNRQVATLQPLTEAGLPPILQALAGTQHFSAEEFDENYYIKPVVEEAIRDMAAYQLRFTPKGPEKETLVEYDLWVDQERYYPLRLVVRSKEETIAVDFLNARAGQPLPENIFDVRVPESAQWIDKTREF